MKLYVLDDHEPVEVQDMMDWCQRSGLGTEAARVGWTELESGITVSTIFLGIDHGLFGERQLFETAVGSDYGYQIMARYPTWEAAEDGHAQVVSECRREADAKSPI